MRSSEASPEGSFQRGTEETENKQKKEDFRESAGRDTRGGIERTGIGRLRLRPRLVLLLHLDEVPEAAHYDESS